MLLDGARGNTATELSSLLDLGADNKDHVKWFSQAHCGLSTLNVTFRVATGLYSARHFNIKKGYATFLEEFYKARIESVDFADNSEKVRLEVNKWLSEKTSSKIQNLLGPGSVSSDTEFLLVSAMYFKANWDSPFNPRSTSAAKFYLDSENTVTVDMMYRKGLYKVGVAEEIKCMALEMPYKGGEYSMVILLPDKVNGLTSVEEGLTESYLRSLLESLELGPLVRLSVPKFKVQRQHGLKDILKALGVNDLFDASRVDLSGMFEKESPAVSNIIQGALLEVSENGTVAAAASMAYMNRPPGLSSTMRIQFTVDHPFMFLIKKNKDNLILFVGSVRNPTF